jgi:hypothetical protein
MSSSAAPILFPIAQFENPDNPTLKDNFVDGGLWANNPTLVGIIEALGMVDLKNSQLDILSVGTSDRPSCDPYSLKNPNWGILDWRAGINIVEMSLSAQSFGYTNAARFLCAALNELGMATRFVRLEQTNKSPEQFSAINIDKADEIAVRTLNELARSDADAIHSKVMRKEADNMDLVQEIFSNLSILR